MEKECNCGGKNQYEGDTRHYHWCNLGSGCDDTCCKKVEVEEIFSEDGELKEVKANGIKIYPLNKDEIKIRR